MQSAFVQSFMEKLKEPLLPTHLANFVSAPRPAPPPRFRANPP